LFLMRACHSGASFVAAFHSETQQAFLEGHVAALQFFGGVFDLIGYDNLKAAVAADSSHIRALLGGSTRGQPPVDRARAGSKHHLLTDAGGLPLAITLTGGHRNDVTQLLPLVDGVVPVTGKVGRPRKPRQVPP
jgi:Transposase DDE domain